MVNRIVSVDDNFDLPEAVAAKLVTQAGVTTAVSSALDQVVVTPTGGALDHARIQGGATQAATDGVRFYAAGSYSTDQTLTIRSDADLTGLTITYTGTGTAVRIGNATARTDRLDVKAPRVISGNKTTTGWAEVAGTVGIDLCNLQSCTILIPYVRGFATGLLESAASTTGNVHNTITLGHLDNNQRNLVITASGGGWTNQNTHMGGRMSHDGGEGTNVTGTRHVELVRNTEHPINNHLFLNTSVEGSTAEYHAAVGGSRNMFLNVRWEASPPRVLWAQDASSNQILFGYYANNIVETGDSLWNVVWSHERLTMNGPGSTAGVLQLTNSTGGAAPTDLVLQPGSTTTPATDYAVSRSVTYTHMKRPSDAFPRITLDHSAGRLYLGNGTAAPTLGLQTVGTTLFVTAATTALGFMSETTDIGTASAYRPRDVNVARYIKLGNAYLRENDGVLEVAASTSGPWTPIGSGGGGTELTSYMDQVASLSDYPAFVAAGTSQTAARDAIGAGTSNLQLGTGSTTAKRGDYTPTVADVPSLPASKVTSGTFAAARIPALNYATTAQGALADTAVQPADLTDYVTTEDLPAPATAIVYYNGTNWIGPDDTTATVRPNAQRVMAFGGTTQPTFLVSGDVWVEDTGA